MPLDEEKRRLNERKFGAWMELPGGGRRYWCEIEGRRGWRARHVKEVDAEEATVRFWQEIYDDTSPLVERHDNPPEDHGHERLRG